MILFPLFATGVIDTGGKFAAGVVDTGGNLPLASLTPVANLMPVWRVELLLYVYTCRSLNSNPRCNMLINPPTG
jgi:hypothetical protein